VALWRAKLALSQSGAYENVDKIRCNDDKKRNAKGLFRDCCSQRGL
jgi:hypothetical protein